MFMQKPKIIRKEFFEILFVRGDSLIKDMSDYKFIKLIQLSENFRQSVGYVDFRTITQSLSSEIMRKNFSNKFVIVKGYFTFLEEEFWTYNNLEINMVTDEQAIKIINGEKQQVPRFAII